MWLYGDCLGVCVVIVWLCKGVCWLYDGCVGVCADTVVIVWVYEGSVVVG